MNLLVSNALRGTFRSSSYWWWISILNGEITHLFMWYFLARYIAAFFQLKIFFSVVNAVGMSGFYWIQVLTNWYVVFYKVIWYYIISRSFGCRRSQRSWEVPLLLSFCLRRRTRHSQSWRISSLIPVLRIKNWSDERCACLSLILFAVLVSKRLMADLGIWWYNFNVLNNDDICTR